MTQVNKPTLVCHCRWIGVSLRCPDLLFVQWQTLFCLYNYFPNNCYVAAIDIKQTFSDRPFNKRLPHKSMQVSLYILSFSFIIFFSDSDPESRQIMVKKPTPTNALSGNPLQICHKFCINFKSPPSKMVWLNDLQIVQEAARIRTHKRPHLEV